MNWPAQRGRLPARRRAAGQRRAHGQALVEFTLLLPLLLLLSVGILEFGMLFKTHMGIHYATREGARIGAAASQLNNADCTILRVVSTTMSTMDYDRLDQVRIYRADTAGICLEPCKVNLYTRPPNYATAGCLEGWYADATYRSYPPDQRVNDPNGPDGLGVEIQYRHRLFFDYLESLNTGNVTVVDRTVTQIEPAQLRPMPTPTPVP